MPGGRTIDSMGQVTRQRTVDAGDESKNSSALVIPKEVISRGSIGVKK